MPFRLGVPATDAFPSKVWARLTAQRWRKRRVSLGDGDPGGEPELLAAADALLPGRLTLEPDAAGLHLVGWLPTDTTDVAASARAREAGVEMYPLSRFRLTPCARESRGALLLGYAPFDREAIRDGVRRLARALDGP